MLPTRLVLFYVIKILTYIDWESRTSRNDSIPEGMPVFFQAYHVGTYTSEELQLRTGLPKNRFYDSTLQDT